MYLVLLFSLAFSSSAVSEVLSPAQQQCHEHIFHKRYEQVINACTDTYGQSWENAIVTDAYISHLGSFNKLSKSGELLLERAKGGDPIAQYLFAVLQFTLAPRSKHNEVINEQVASRTLKWLLMAAEQGHEPAMIAYIKRVIPVIGLPTQEQHENGSRFSKKLLKSLGPQAQVFVRAFRKLPHQGNWREKLDAMLNDLSVFSIEELHDLSRALLLGSIEFDSGIPGSLGTSVDIPAMPKERLRILNYLDTNHQDGMAAYNLAQLNKDDLLTYETYFASAIDRNYPAALRFLGLYFACTENMPLAKNYLFMAKSLGNTNAADDIEELLEYGNIYECPEFRFSDEFVSKYL